jgi:NTP pyrophosphatase (non-canonical NTP hydrolase)
MTAQRAALETFGLDHQLIKLAEECAELAQAALKLRLYGPDPKRQANLLEECADVEIMLEQMRLHYGEEAIDAQRSRKLTRLEGRLNVPTQPFRAPSYKPQPELVDEPKKPRGKPGPKPKPKPPREAVPLRMRKARAVLVNGVTYPSLSKAARAHGATQSYLCKLLREGGGRAIWRGITFKEVRP